MNGGWIMKEEILLLENEVFICPVCGQENSEYELEQNLGDCFNCNTEIKKG